MNEIKAEYEKKLQKVKDIINADIEKKGVCLLDKNDIGWEELVDLSTEYSFNYPLDIDKVIAIRSVEK